MSSLPDSDITLEADDLPAGASSCRRALKATSLLGGASILAVFLGMIHTKFVAVLLGPAGVGLLGMFGQVTSVVGTLTGLGLGSSGVRQVAEAIGSQDESRIARTVVTLRRMAWLTGGLGLLTMVGFCVPLSWMTFGTDEFSSSIAVLGITLLTGALASGQGSIVNGSRRIGDLARISVAGAAASTLLSVPCYFLWGASGIVPSLVLSAVAVLAASWWFARRVPIKLLTLPWRDCCEEARELLALGISFMGAGLVTTLSGFFIRTAMLDRFALADVGIYQAAYNLSGVLVGFVLGAMGADYYPRLTAVAGDNVSLRRMVNEQTQISILLALPGLATMMVFAPLIISVFYAGSFVTAVPLLRWCTLGILGRVLSWPMGFVMLAKGKGKVYFLTEVFAAAFHLGAVCLFIRVWGVEGAGIAFMALYLVYTGLMLVVVQRLVGATWQREVLWLAVGASAIMGFLMCVSSLDAGTLAGWAVNLSILCALSLYCVRRLLHMTGVSWSRMFGGRVRRGD